MNHLFRRINSHSLQWLFIQLQNKQISSNCWKQLNAINILHNKWKANEDSIKCLNEWQLMRTITSSTQMNVLNNKLIDNFWIQKRFKKMKKASKQQKKESSDEESDEEADQSAEDDPDLIDGKAVDFVDINTTIISLRLDVIAKTGLNIQRNKVDEYFYNNLFRVNGERVAKKSIELAENDELDFIRGLNLENSDLIEISKVVVKKIEDKMSSTGRVKVKLRRFKLLKIPNYANDPYDGILISRERDHE